MTHQSQGQIQADYDRALGALDDHKAAERHSALTHWCPKCSTLGYRVLTAANTLNGRVVLSSTASLATPGIPPHGPRFQRQMAARDVNVGFTPT